MPQGDPELLRTTLENRHPFGLGGGGEFSPNSGKGEKSVLDGYRFRLYPDKDQQHILLRWIGCQRLIYNAKVRDPLTKDADFSEARAGAVQSYAWGD